MLRVGAVCAEETPIDVLKGMSDRVIAIVEQDPDILNDKVRLRTIANAIIVPNVDFVVFSKWVLGKHWRKATPEQRKVFITEFRETLINSYLSSITRDDYQNQTIRYESLRGSQNPDKVVVDATIEQPSGPLIHVQFRMYRNNEQRWLVYDVVVEGVSLVTTHRSNFSSIIREKGLDGLIAMLEERNVPLAGPGKPDAQ
jgi:phospholipid transport system substrate-binding protein